MSHYDDVSSRGRSPRSRDPAGSTAAAPPPPYPPSEPTGAYEEVPWFPSSPGRTPRDDPEEAYEELPSQRNALSLRVPESAAAHSQMSRPRSLPPPLDNRDLQSSRHGTRERQRRDRDRRWRRHSQDYGSEAPPRTPVDRARGFLGDTFTDSKAGLGVGVLGALVGGLAAKEASDATSRHNGHHRRDDPEYKRNQMISTAVGAVVGALGANAFEKRLEDNREKSRSSRERSREISRSEQRYYLPDSVSGGGGGGGKSTRFLDKTEIIARPRSRSRDSNNGAAAWRPEWDPWEGRDRDGGGSRSRSRRGSGSRRSLEREVDTGARSWKNVEDWVYDDTKSGGGRPSGGEYRY